MTSNLTQIEQLANSLNNDIAKVKTELKRVQSIKCRLKKQKFKSTYDVEMTEVLKAEQALKEVRSLLECKSKPVPEYTQADVDMLNYDDTIKAIKSIQSKKTLSKYLTPVPGDNDVYRQACVVESMLQAHRLTQAPIDASVVKKTDVQTIIDTIQSNKDLSQDTLVDLLKKLM